jgi:drug/metabolite transporter (DMT)-like permease
LTGAYLAGFLVLAGLDTAAHVMFKLAAMQSLPLEATWSWVARVAGIVWVYGAMACYVGTFFTWMTLLRRAPLGPAFAASHLDVVTVLVASACLLGERISPLQLVGAALILAGIACLAFSESTAAEAVTSPARRKTIES